MLKFIILSFIIVTTLSFTIDYIVFKKNYKSFYEMAGITGGVFSLSKKIITISGNLLIKLFHKIYSNSENKEIEMN